MSHTRSVLMDAATLHAHRGLCGTGPPEKRHTSTLTRLDAAELALYGELRDNLHDQHIRLEQERIGYGWVRSVLDR